MAEGSGKTSGNCCSCYAFPCLEESDSRGPQGLNADTAHQGDAEDSHGRLEDDLQKIERSAFEESYNKIFQRRTKEQNEILQRVNKIVSRQQQAWENLNDSLERKVRSKIIEGGFELARLIIAKALDSEPSLVNHVVKRAIRLVRANSNIVIKANADDWQTISELIESLQRQRQDLGQIRVESDSTIERGGCLIETDYGIIDARIGSQLDVIRRAVES